MKKLLVFLSVIFSSFVWFSFASPTVVNHEYAVEGNSVKIYRTNNSNWGNVDINVQNPQTKDWMHFGTAKISDQVFSYVKQWDWDQEIWMIPDDWWDEIKFTIKSAWDNKAAATRTVIPVVPKTGPSISLIWLIIATLMIFGWYIYIKRKADI